MPTNNAINLSAQGVAYYNGTGTFSTPTITNHAPVIGDTANDIKTTAAMTNGQVLIGSTAVDPVPATLTAGTGISITNGAGSITVSSTAGGITWNDVTGTSASMAVNNGYLANNAGLVTLTLPATAVQFSVIRIAGFGAGGWTIAQNANQAIQVAGGPRTTTGVGGSLSSTNQYDTIELIAAVGGASTIWLSLSLDGNLTIV